MFYTDDSFEVLNKGKSVRITGIADVVEYMKHELDNVLAKNPKDTGIWFTLSLIKLGETHHFDAGDGTEIKVTRVKSLYGGRVHT